MEAGEEAGERGETGEASDAGAGVVQIGRAVGGDMHPLGRRQVDDVVAQVANNFPVQIAISWIDQQPQ